MRDYNRERRSGAITRKDLSYFIAIFLVAFFLRYQHITAFDVGKNVASPFWLVDSSPYLYSATKILANEPFFPWQAPFASYFIAIVLLLFNNSYFAVKIGLAMGGSISCGIIYLIGVKLFNRAIGLLAAILSASYFGLIITSGSFNSEVLYTASLSLIVLLICQTGDRASISNAILLGFLFGLAALSRGEFIVLLPFIFLGYWHGNRLHWRNKVLMLSISFLVMLLTILPWSIKNYYFFKGFNEKLGEKVYSEFVPLSPYGQFIFALSNSPLSQGGATRRVWGSNLGPFDWDMDKVDERLFRKLYLHGFEEGFKFIKEYPSYFLELTAKRMDYLSDSLTFGIMAKNFPVGLKGYFRECDSFVPNHKYLKWFHLPILIVGFILCLKSNREYILFLPFIVISTVLTNIFYFGLTRNGLSIIPFVFLMEAAGLYYLLSKFFKVNLFIYFEKYVLGVLAVVALVGFWETRKPIQITLLPELFTKASQAYDSGNTELAIDLHEQGFVEVEKKESIITSPLGMAYFHYKLATLYYAKMDFLKAEREALKALQYDPVHQQAIYYLAKLYLNELKNPDKAMDLFQDLLWYYPNDPHVSEIKKELIRRGLRLIS